MRRDVDAADGLAALRLAREAHPDLILLDVGLPAMDGFTVCRELKQDASTRDIAIVMLTAAGSESDRAAGQAAGADAYFTKPFSPTALVRKVKEIIGP